MNDLQFESELELFDGPDDPSQLVAGLVLFLGFPLPFIKFACPEYLPISLYIIQSISFVALLALSITYKPIKGTVEEIDGPDSELHELHELAGMMICLDISLWFFNWTWLDLRFLPLAALAFIFSFIRTPKMILGDANYVSKFPSSWRASRKLEDVERQ